MEVVFLVIHRDRGLVPIGDHRMRRIKRQHIIHRRQIGFRIANHDFHFQTHAIIHFSDAARALVDRVFERRIVVKPNVVCGFTSEREGNAFFRGYGGLRQGQTNVSGGAYENYAVVVRQPNWRQRFSGSSRCYIQHQIGLILKLFSVLLFRSAKCRKQLFLVLVKRDVRVFIQIRVLLDESVRIQD